MTVGWPERAAAACARLMVAAAGRRDAVSILALHSIRAQHDPLFPGELGPVDFERLVAHIARAHHALPLGEAHRALTNGRVPRGAVVITFDDGYADNAEIVLPILQRHGLRASFFVSTAFMEGGLMWNDQVIENIRRCPAGELDLSRWGLGVRPLGSAESRRAAIDALLPVVKYLTLPVREEALAALHETCGRPELPVQPMMTPAQVRRLADAGMEIGGHTVHHPILARLDDAQAEREIVEGRDRLRALTGAAVDVFAYPNGVPDVDFQASHVALLRRLGFRCAVTTARGIARTQHDPLQYPRFTPWDRSLGRWSLRMLAARRLRVPQLAV